MQHHGQRRERPDRADHDHADHASQPAAYPLASLKSEKAFRQVRRYGAAQRGRLFTLHVTDYRPSYGKPWQPAAYIGIVVPKKVLKNATDRNRVRRRVREALRTLPQTLGQPLPACRAVLYPAPEALHAPFQELQAALAKAVTDIPSSIERSRSKRKKQRSGRKKPNHA